MEAKLSEGSCFYYLEGFFHLVFWEDSLWSWQNPTYDFKYCLLFHFTVTCCELVQITFSSRSLVMFPSSCLSFCKFSLQLKDSKSTSVAPCIRICTYISVYICIYCSRQIPKQRPLHHFSLFFIMFLILDLKDAILGKLMCCRINSNSLCKPSLLKNAFLGAHITWTSKSELLHPAWREF